jgi:hypothetical protein
MGEIMLRVDRGNKALDRLQEVRLRDAQILERSDLQQMIRNSPDSFCKELGEVIWFVGEEVAPDESVQDRVDLLGVDPDGVAVIIEIKRDSHKLHLLQALSYAGMISKWEPRDFIQELVHYNSRHLQAPQSFEAAKEELEDQLEGADSAAVNRSQRVVLLAEDFDYEVLVTAEWLTEKHGVDIRCYRLLVARQGEQIFLSCNRAYPPPELTDIATRRRRAPEEAAPQWDNWAAALGSVHNLAVVDFFRHEIDSGSEAALFNRKLKYSVAGRRRYYVYAKSDGATVFQFGRFAGDVEYWKKQLPTSQVAEVTNGRRLRFYLHTADEFARFKRALSEDLSQFRFSRTAEGLLDDEGEEPAGDGIESPKPIDAPVAQT